MTRDHRACIKMTLATLVLMAGASRTPAQVPPVADSAAEVQAVPTPPAELLAVRQALATVKIPSLTGAVEPDTIQGLFLPNFYESIPGSWVVIPWSTVWKTHPKSVELGTDWEGREKVREWFRTLFQDATVETAGFSGPVEFVDLPPMLPMFPLVLLRSSSPAPEVPAVTVYDGVKHEGAQVLVLNGHRTVEGTMTVEYPSDTFPWRVKLEGDAEATTGAVVVSVDGKLLGVLLDLEGTTPSATEGNSTVLIPASYVTCLIGMQHPGLTDDLKRFSVGMEMGRERALLELRDSTTAANTPIPATGFAAADPNRPVASVPSDATSGAPPPAENELRIFSLQHLSAAEALFVIEWIQGSRVTVTQAPNNRGIIAVGSPSDVQTVRTLLTKLDVAPPATWPGQKELQSGVEYGVPVDQQVGQIQEWLSSRVPRYVVPQGEIHIFELQHITPRATVATLATLFGRKQSNQLGGFAPAIGRGGGDEDDGPQRTCPTIVFLPTRPLLIVRASAEDLLQIEAILERLDEPSDSQEAAGTPDATPSDATGSRESDESVMVLQYTSGNRSAEAIAGDLHRLVPSVDVSVKAVAKQTLELTGPGRAVYYVHAMIRLLDVAQNGAADSVDSFPIADPADTKQLRIAYAEHQARLQAMAEEARQAVAALGERAAIEQQSALREIVAEAFEARQQLQRAELGALETKIAAMRRTLESREQIKDQIINRRVEELLNPALEWETTGESSAPTVGSTGTTTRMPYPGSSLPRAAVAPYQLPQSDPDAVTEEVAEPTVDERLYQGRSETEWRRLFAAETDPAAKLEGAIALLNLSAPLTQEQQFERILEVGTEFVQWKYGDHSLEFAFESLPPQRWNILGDEQRKAYLRFHQEETRICESLPPAVMAAQLADALNSTSAPRAAFGLSLLTYTVQTRVADDADASRLLLERLGRVDPAAGDAFAFLKLFAKVYVSASANDEELAALADEIVAACQAVRTSSTPADGFEFPPRYWLTSLRLPDSVLQDPRVPRALAEVIADDVIHGRMTAHIIQSHLSVPPTVSDLQSQVEHLRSLCGPALHGWLGVANDSLKAHQSAPYSGVDRAILQGTYRAINVYSDGDGWPVAETAELLTEQLRAAYTDDPSATVDKPISDLLPTSPLRLLSSIVTITGEIPDFVKTGTPRSAHVAEKLAILDQLLAGEVTGRRIGEQTDKLSGLLGEAPVETVRRLIAASTRSEANLFLGPFNRQLEPLLSTGSPLNPERPTSASGSGPVVGGFGSEPTRSRPSIDALLLLAIFTDMAGTDREQDAKIASLEAIDLGGAFRWQIQGLLASKLQSRHHATRMLRDMAAKTESPELLDMIRAIDPNAVTAAKQETP